MMTKTHWGSWEIPSLRALLAFEAAARSKNFTLAAAELNLTPGAISRQITQLESHLQARLFYRHHHNARLTATGQTYLAAISPALSMLAQASSRISGNRHEKVVRVNALPSFTLRWVIPRLSLFQQKHPDILVRLDTTRDLEDITTDFDISIRRPASIASDHKQIPLMTEFFLPVCSKEFFDKNDLGNERNIFTSRLIHMSRAMNLWHDWGTPLGMKVEYKDDHLKLDDWHYIINSAQSSLGVAIAPAALVIDDIDSGRLIPARPSQKLPTDPYRIIHSKKKSLSKSTNSFISWIKEMGLDTEKKYVQFIP
jgi:LysR family glycine cleavage system transcriptional activator